MPTGKTIMPIENLQNFEKREGNLYPLLPKALYQCELLDVGTQENETYESKMGNTKEKEYQTDIKYQFTILQGRDENQDKEELKELRCRNVWENYGYNYLFAGKNGKNNLWRIVEAFLGRELTQEEQANGISSDLLNTFIGKQINVSVETKVSQKGKSFDKIIDYLKVNIQLTPLTDEEREKARVKVNDDKQEVNDTKQPQAGHINDQAPPFGEPDQTIEDNVDNIPM